MCFTDLPAVWQRVFGLAWESVCMGSRAIGAVIADAAGNILSEGRNRTGECGMPNPRTAHAETEAVSGLDVQAHPELHSYTLYAGLEPCIMCMGTLVMGGIRHVEIAARDDFGGAMGLIQHSPFAAAKGITVTFTDPFLADMQRAFQTVRERIYNRDAEKLARMLADFSVHNKKGVDAARQFMAANVKPPESCTAAEIFDALAYRIEAMEHG
jgi:tRNA(Arg) A34 adenosine deaminase TadA